MRTVIGVLVVVVIAACGQLELGVAEQESGGTCTGTHDVCRPVLCTYEVGPDGASSHCMHNREQDAVCDFICRDRGGGRCGNAADFEVIDCIESCRNSPNGVLCRATCYNNMPGYCEPSWEDIVDDDRTNKLSEPVQATQL